jgi:alcohol dehydrogenase (cytochrome c)
MAVGVEALTSRRNSTRSSIVCRISVCFALFLLCPISGWRQEVWADGLAPRADDWITINKDYSSQRYVALDQITPANVGNLKEVCEIQLNEPNLFSSGILKVGRTLYTSTVRQTVAFDATTCDSRWHKTVIFQKSPAASNHYGLGYLNGKIFRGTTDGQLIALDANTGEVLWDVDAADPTMRESFTSAPIGWQGKVFIGIATSDLKIAGRLMAFDANTGAMVWSFQTIVAEPNQASPLAGGGLWATYSLDPKTGEVFAGIANPFPDFNRDTDTPGSIIFTNSVISVDAAARRLNWRYQAVPHDEHDWDLAVAPTLYHTSKGGTGRDMLAITGKSGRVYGIDRSTHLPTFDTPATTVENDEVPVNSMWMHVCPGLQGGAMFTGPAYDPTSGTLYVGMADHCAWYVKSNDVPLGIPGIKDWPAAAKLEAPIGWITAIDGETGTVLWKYQAESQVLAGLVPTKSGLLFGGDTHSNLLVFNAKNGRLLKSIDTGGALNSGLISYSEDGVQYVAATVGGSTENPSTVAGPLRVVVYSLRGSDAPKVVTLPRLEPAPLGGIAANQVAYGPCGQCHSVGAQAASGGGSAPPLGRQSQLADPELLKQFLATVPPPMPRLYPGVLTDSDVKLIADYLKTSVFMCDSTNPPPPQRCAPPAPPSSGGTRAWRAIYTDLTSPRCINCHPVASPKLLPYAWNPAKNAQYPQDYPRQGDDRHPHYYTVLRGDRFPFPTAENPNVIVYPGMGTPYEHCTDCHGTKNDPVTGIPGTTNPNFHPGEPFWALAPASMAWESEPGVPLTGPQLCTALLDMSKNGKRTPAELLEHITNEPLVKWAFNPGIEQNGKPRTTPPIPQAALIQAFEEWIAEGTPCPQ